MRNLGFIILSALLCVSGTAVAQELKWSDFTVSDNLDSPTRLIFDWDAKRTSITKDNIRYKYISVHSKLISAQARPEYKTPEELSHCQTLADFSEAWARALQDSLISVTGNSGKVAALFKDRYLKGLQEGDSTGDYHFPPLTETPFDITTINIKEDNNGVILGLGVAAAMPLGDYGKLATPIAGVILNLGIALKQNPLELNVVVGKGNVKELYMHVSGPRRGKQLPYLNFSVNYYQPVIKTGKARTLVFGGAGYSMTKFTRFEKRFLNVPVNGLSLSAGIAYEHKLGLTTYNLAGNHHESQNKYLRFRLYSDNILTKTAWMPTVNISASLITLGRNLYRGD